MPSAPRAAPDRPPPVNVDDLRSGFIPIIGDRALNYSLAAPCRSPALDPPRSPTPSPARQRPAPRPRSPGPGQKAGPPAANEPLSLSASVPSWITAWSKPTVSSSQLHDGPQMRDFVAMPIPASSISRIRRAQNLSTGGVARPISAGGAATSSPANAPNSPARPGAPLRATSMGRQQTPAQADGAESTTTGGGGSVLMHFVRASSNTGQSGAAALTTASSAPLLFRSMAAARSAWSPTVGSGAAAAAGPGKKFAGGAWAWVVTQPAGGGRPASAGLRRMGSMRGVAATTAGGAASSLGGGGASQQQRPRPLSAGPMRGNRPLSAGADFGADAPPPANPGSLGALLLQRMNSRNFAASRPASASAGGNGAQRAAAPRPPPVAVGFEPEPPRRRGPATALELLGLGPDDADLGYLVDASDLLLAGGPATPLPTVVASAPPAGPDIGAAYGFDEEEGAPSPTIQLVHMPLPQHVLLPGSLQDLYERIGRSGDRPLHFSLGAVTFSGELEPSLNDTIRIQNRIVILHNCTLVLRPGQRLWVGDGGHLILADVNIYASTTASASSGASAAAGPTANGGASASTGAAANSQGGSGGGGGGKMLPAVPSCASPPASPPLAPSPKRTAAQSRLRGTGSVSFSVSGLSGRNSGGCGGGGDSDGDGEEVPMLHVTTGGRMLLRGCRIKVLAPGEPVPSAPTSTGGPILAAPPHRPSAQPPPRSPRPAHVRGGGTAAAAAAATAPAPAGPFLAPSSPRGAAPFSTVANTANTANSANASTTAAAAAASAVSLGSLVCVMADGGAIVEAVGCRLGRCSAVDADTSLTLRRCRIKPGSACPRDAPLLSVSAGAYLYMAATEIRDGPGVGLSASGPADTCVEVTHSAVNNCGSHGVMVTPGVEMSASSCRVSGNAASGLAARGRGASVVLSDCELTRNSASNLWASNGGQVRLTACALLGSVEGCGLNVEGKASRAAAEGCAFDGNGACGVRVRRNAELDLRDCSASGNATHGIDVEGTFDASDNAERLAEATLAAEIPPPPPLPDIFVVVAGGQLAKNGCHGCRVTAGGGLRVTGCEMSQNGEDGAYSDGPGCELLIDSCRIVRNNDNGVFICSGAAVWVDGTRLGGNLLGHVAVGGRGSRGRLTRCTFEYSPVTALRVQMGAKVALRDCEMESAPVAAPGAKAAPLTRVFYNVDEIRKRNSNDGSDDESGDILDGERPWAVGSIRSKYVKLMGQGSLLSIDGRAIFATIGDDGRPLGT